MQTGDSIVAPSSSGRPSRLRHLPELDGLRAVSILIVAAAHCGFGNVIPGGLGVTIFFFLSGFLITNLLEREFTSSGSIDVREFFLRRFFRLAPAFLTTVLAADLLVGAGLVPGGVTLGGTLAQVFYFANYYLVYFYDGHSIPEGTGIFWSLAVEEHFYLLYPLVASTLLMSLSRHRRGVWLAVACAAVLAWRLFLSLRLGASSDRIYYCTDTRIDSILYGCLMATLFPTLVEASMQVGRPPPRWKRAAMWGAGLSLLALSLAVRSALFRDTLRYSVQGVALLFVFHLILTDRGQVKRLLSSPPMVSLGKYSYAFYLCHYVIAQALVAHTRLTFGSFAMLPLVVGLAWLYAMVVTTLIESPIRRRFARSRVRLLAPPSTLSANASMAGAAPD